MTMCCRRSAQQHNNTMRLITFLGYNMLFTFSIFMPVVSSMAVETRRSILTTWNPSSSASTKVLGWALERKDSDKQQYQITISWTHSEDCDGDDERVNKRRPPTTIELPFLSQVDSLASSLWPASLAGSILFHSPAWRQQLHGKNVLELGSGVGLAGLAAAAAAASYLHSSSVVSSSESGSTWLTDYDPQAVELLQQSIEKNQELFVTPKSLSSSVPPQVFAKRLDWRDPPELQQLRSSSSSDDDRPFQIALGTDVCYYYHLLRPLMDTIQRKLQPMESSSGSNDSLHKAPKLLCLVGQANRQSLWDMYHNIANGCYNQVTDQRDPPWPGTTVMLLYQMYMGTWVTAASEEVTLDDQNLQDIPSLEPLDGILPMAALLHSTLDGPAFQSSFSLIRPIDYVATKVDEEAQMKSF